MATDFHSMDPCLPPKFQADDAGHPVRQSGGAFAPLSEPQFRMIWTATLVSNLGSWMMTVGESWLMTSLSPSALMVSLMQVTTLAPMLILSLPAGVLADSINRRAILLVTQSWMMIVAVVLAITTALGVMTPTLLILFALALGIGNAINSPAWRAITPEIVSPANLPQAVVLNGLSVNGTRSIGPAIGGVIIAASGPWAVFAINAVSFIVVIAVLVRWREKPLAAHRPRKSGWTMVSEALHYARDTRSVRAALWRTAALFPFVSVLFALMPIKARGMTWGADGYGLMFAALGVGAVVGALMLPRLRLRFSSETIVTAGALIMVALLAALGLIENGWLLLPIMAVGGIGWISILSTIQAELQLGTPREIQGRVLAIYLMVFGGVQSAGSIIWGLVADRASLGTAYLVAAVGLFAAAAIVGRLVSLPDLASPASTAGPTASA